MKCYSKWSNYNELQNKFVIELFLFMILTGDGESNTAENAITEDDLIKSLEDLLALVSNASEPVRLYAIIV